MDLSRCSPGPCDHGTFPARDRDVYAAFPLRYRVAREDMITQCNSRMRLSKTRKLMLDCLVVDALMSALPTSQSHHELEMLILQRGLQRDRICQLLRKATKYRVGSIEDLTKIEALVVWHLLGGGDA
jgi:hypothetical protein